MEDLELSKLALDELEHGEADPDRDGTLDPVHAQSLVESNPDAFVPPDRPERRPD